MSWRVDLQASSAALLSFAPFQWRRSIGTDRSNTAIGGIFPRSS